MGVNKPYRWLQRKFWAMNLAGKSTDRIFTDIYAKNKWRDKESISGPGSTLAETEQLRAALGSLFREMNIKTIIDLPCGDFNWFRMIDYPFESYTGCDIVEPLIVANNEKYGTDKRKFLVKNCLIDPLGKADMLFCRDMLLHFCFEDIFRFLDNFQRSEIQWLLISNGIGLANKDIPTGQSRLINLTAPPFDLPEPRKIIMEHSKLGEGRFRDVRCMALWHRDDLTNLDFSGSGTEEKALRAAMR